MNRTVLFIYVLTLLTHTVLTQQKLHVGIFYESLCPDSIRFIKNQLEPVYNHFDSFVKIDFIPFGKSKSLRTGNGIEFTCQHGPDECSGNKIHSCALMMAPTQAAQTEFVTCQMSYGVEGSDSCAEQAGLPYPDILACHSSDLGTQLQLEAEAKTKSLASPRELLSFVPTIVYNHEFDELKQERSLFEFRKILCEELQLTSNEIPSICTRN